MKKLFLGLTAIVIVITGIFTFAGCEKEEAEISAQNIVKCWDDNLNFNEGLFISYPDNPEILINTSNGEAYTVNGVLLEDADGQGNIARNTEGVVVGITCVPGGNNCGRAFLEQNGDIVKEGIYVHELDEEGAPIVTYFDWNQVYRR